MSRLIVTTAAAALVLACSTQLQAQRPFSLELRGGAAFPAADVGDTSLQTGAGFEVSARYRVQPHLLAYIGWDWYRFAPESQPSGSDLDLGDTGYALGLQFQHPLARSTEGWFRAGAVYNHIEVEDGSDIIADSGHELGWEAGAGVSFAIGRSFALTPGVRYRTFSAELDLGDGGRNVDLSYVTAEVGLAWSFGGAHESASALR